MTTRISVKIAKEIADVLEGKVGKTADLMACKQVPTIWLQRWFLTLAPPPRKAPTKTALSRLANRVTVKQLDDLFRELIRKRDEMRCRRCKKESRLQVHHIFSRRHHRIRWASTNGLLLCAGCHLWVHEPGKDREHTQFFEEMIGAREYLKLGDIVRVGGKPQDHKLVKLLLEKEMRP
jgi:hypothetical protein